MMDIFVVSRSRFEESHTLEGLGPEAKHVHLVVPACQKSKYKLLAKRYGCNLIGCPYDGISLTRRLCGSLASSKFLMLDDDLTFYRRVSSRDWHLKYPEDIPGCCVKSLLQLVEDELERYAHVAISAREGNNRLPYEGVECSRPLRALAYRKKEFLSVVHGRVQIMEDFDVTMQLLRKGYKNHVIASWAQGQITTQMVGGCSDYRTHELHENNVRKFASLHSQFVSLRQKRNKSGGEFGNRLEATIYWKKAWESSQ